MGIMYLLVEVGRASWICEKRDHLRQTLTTSFSDRLSGLRLREVNESGTRSPYNKAVSVLRKG